MIGIGTPRSQSKIPLPMVVLLFFKIARDLHLAANRINETSAAPSAMRCGFDDSIEW
jgi:hypothetical protein